MVSDSQQPALPRLSGPELANLRASAWHLPALGHVVLEWSVIGLSVAAAMALDRAWFTAVAWILIASRQHALTALAHEAAHGRLASGRWNMLLGETCLAWPLGLSLHSYRRQHLAHHGFLSTEQDPDWLRNRPDRWGLPASWFHRLRHLAGLQASQGGLVAMYADRSADARRARAWRLGRVTYYGIAGLLVWKVDALALLGLYWFAPMFLLFYPLMRLRGLAEHWAVRDDHPLRQTRTLLLSPLGRLFFLPKNMGYHLEHHLYPQLPFQELPGLHRRLMQQEDYRSEAHVTRGVPRFLRELFAFRR